MSGRRVQRAAENRGKVLDPNYFSLLVPAVGQGPEQLSPPTEAYLTNFPTVVLYAKDEWQTPLAAVSLKVRDADLGHTALFLDHRLQPDTNDVNGLIDREGSDIELLLTNLTDDDGYLAMNLMRTAEHATEVDPGPNKGFNQVNEIKPSQSISVAADQATRRSMRILAKASKKHSGVVRTLGELQDEEAATGKKTELDEQTVQMWLSVLPQTGVEALVAKFKCGTFWRATDEVIRQVDWSKRHPYGDGSDVVWRGERSNDRGGEERGEGGYNEEAFVQANALRQNMGRSRGSRGPAAVSHVMRSFTSPDRPDLGVITATCVPASAPLTRGCVTMDDSDEEGKEEESAALADDWAGMRSKGPIEVPAPARSDTRKRKGIRASGATEQKIEEKAVEQSSASDSVGGYKQPTAVVRASKVARLVAGSVIDVHSGCTGVTYAFGMPNIPPLLCLSLSIAAGNVSFRQKRLTPAAMKERLKELKNAVEAFAKSGYASFLTKLQGKFEAEDCVVCLEKMSLNASSSSSLSLPLSAPVRFYSCGHLVCHSACALKLELCPMCRAKIGAQVPVVVAASV